MKKWWNAIVALLAVGLGATMILSSTAFASNPEDQCDENPGGN